MTRRFFLIRTKNQLLDFCQLQPEFENNPNEFRENEKCSPDNQPITFKPMKKMISSVHTRCEGVFRPEGPGPDPEELHTGCNRTEDLNIWSTSDHQDQTDTGKLPESGQAPGGAAELLQEENRS
ncbi:uncharacterized protein V6R79_022183 [Siganus canaliculatus]